MPQNRPITRKLTTILAADAANYSGRMRRDETGTVRALRASRDIIDRAIAAGHGRIANTSGDGLIAEFPSVVEAVCCAITVQRALNTAPDLLPFRLGVHLGDVIIEGEDLLGDGVNLAARLQEMAEVGGILMSQQVMDQVRGKIPEAEFRPLGPSTPKHFEGEIALYAVVADGIAAPRLLDNLGPKVQRAAAPMPEPSVQPAPTPAAEAQDPGRAEFVRFRNRILGVIGGLVVVDVVFGAPFLSTAIPQAALLYILYRRWIKWRGSEGSAASG